MADAKTAAPATIAPIPKISHAPGYIATHEPLAMLAAAILWFIGLALWLRGGAGRLTPICRSARQTIFDSGARRLVALAARHKWRGCISRRNLHGLTSKSRSVEWI